MADDAVIEGLKAIAHPLRLKVMQVLARGEHNVGEIEEATRIGQPALSQQLGVLRKAGLVETRKDAKLVYYRLDSTRMSALRQAVGELAAADTADPMLPSIPSRGRSPGAANFARLT